MNNQTIKITVLSALVVLLGFYGGIRIAYGVDIYAPQTAGGLSTLSIHWDNVNSRLGIATTSPGSIFSVNDSVNFVARATSTIYNALGIGTTSAAFQFSVATTTATTTIGIGSAIGGFGSCIQMYAASGTPYRMYVSGQTQSATAMPLRVERGGCGDSTPRP